MINTIKSVGFDTDDLQERAQILAKRLNLPVDNQLLPRLSFIEDKLVLLMENFSPLFVDFNSSKLRKRREMGKKEGLIRACKPEKGLRILDVTAGWGRDATLLASFGAEVLMLERQPIMAALLADGLRRLPTSSKVLSLIEIDAKSYLQTLEPANYPDVIYLDPMHPLRQKSALVKKDMQALQQLIGADIDALELLQLAITKMKQRVVVKWPQKLAPLLPPQFSINGETIRFDVYLR
jgi:16S rRNA (guanine1516-N2)-methyltransferase